MIFFLDYLYNLPNATEGLDSIVVQTATAVSSFVPLLLLFIYLVIFIGGVIRQKRRIGTADYAMWSTISSITTFFVSLILTLGEGLMSLEWLVTVIVITIFSGIWLFLDHKASEI